MICTSLNGVSVEGVKTSVKPGSVMSPSVPFNQSPELPKGLFESAAHVSVTGTAVAFGTDACLRRSGGKTTSIA